MDLKAKSFVLEMDFDEAWGIAFDLRRSLEYTLETHWVNHQNSWRDNEKRRLERLKTFFFNLGRPELYEEIYTIAENTFEKFNKKRGTK